ncbi:MAG: fibronectin type III domain-containing protein, partial [Planctomycetaceae bacterium]
AGGSSPPLVVELPATASSYSLANLALDTRYDVRLLAYNVGGTSVNNPTASFVTSPNPPLALQVGGATLNSLLLTWADTNRTAEGFRLQSSSDRGLTWVALPLPQGTAVNSFRVESLQSDVAYLF